MIGVLGKPDVPHRAGMTFLSSRGPGTWEEDINLALKHLVDKDDCDTAHRRHSQPRECQLIPVKRGSASPGLPFLSSLCSKLLPMLQGPLSHALLCEAYSHPIGGINLFLFCDLTALLKIIPLL